MSTTYKCAHCNEVETTTHYSQMYTLHRAKSSIIDKYQGHKFVKPKKLLFGYPELSVEKKGVDSKQSSSV